MRSLIFWDAAREESELWCWNARYNLMRGFFSFEITRVTMAAVVKALLSVRFSKVEGSIPCWYEIY